MEIKGNYNGGMVFSRNPIIVSESFPGADFHPEGGSLIISGGGTPVYRGRFYPPLRLDISEIIDSVTDYFPEVPEDNAEPLVSVETARELRSRRMNIRASYGDIESETDILPVAGGISMQNFRTFLRGGGDAFTRRFLNPDANFFLTTRSASHTLVIRETELAPLYFIIDGQIENITLRERVTNTDFYLGAIEDGVWALDPAAMRRWFADNSGVLANVFDIYTGDAPACRIVIEEAPAARERYRLKFRNSLGVFEVVELTEEMSVTAEYADADSETFDRYDIETGGYYTARGRAKQKRVLESGSGFRRRDELRFLTDMLASEEVWLTDTAGAVPIRVIPSADSISFAQRPTVPEKIAIKLEVADRDANIMQDVVDGGESMAARIFSYHFSPEFA